MNHHTFATTDYKTVNINLNSIIDVVIEASCVRFVARAAEYSVRLNPAALEKLLPAYFIPVTEPDGTRHYINFTLDEGYVPKAEHTVIDTPLGPLRVIESTPWIREKLNQAWCQEFRAGLDRGGRCTPVFLEARV